MSEQLDLRDEEGWTLESRERRKIMGMIEKHKVRKILSASDVGREALLRAGILKPNAPNQDRFSGQTVQPMDTPS